MRVPHVLHLTAIVTLLVASLCLIGKGAYMQAKAHFAQYLIMQAWELTLKDRQAHKPWSWADTYPVSKLTFLPAANDPQIDAGPDNSLYVLAGASGRNLAFGPAELNVNSRELTGNLSGNTRGNRVIAGHNDTHFAILDGVKKGRLIQLQDANGKEVIYRVTGTNIVHESDTRVLAPSDDRLLTLITCYPFNSVEVGGELRLVVKAEAIAG